MICPNCEETDGLQPEPCGEHVKCQNCTVIYRKDDPELQETDEGSDEDNSVGE